MINSIYWITLCICLFGTINPLFCQQDEINRYIEKIAAQPFDQSNYLKLAELYQNNNNEDKVGDVFYKMLEYWPRNAHLWYRWALALSLMNKHLKSLPKYSMSLKLDPKQHKVMYNYSISLVQVGKFNKALEVMEKACELEPNNYKYLIFKNKILLSISPNKLVDLSENNIFIAQYNEAIQYYNTNNLAAALTSIDKALEANPSSDKALMVKSQILLDQKKYEQAIILLQQLVTNNPHNNEAHFYLGEAHYITKDYDASFLHFFRSLPNNNSQKEAINNCNAILNIMKIQGNCNYSLYTEQLAPFIEKNDQNK